MGLDEAAVNVGNGNGLWIILMTWLSGGFGVILAALIAGVKGQEIAEPLKMGVICMWLMPVFGIGWLLAMLIACKTKSRSDA